MVDVRSQPTPRPRRDREPTYIADRAIGRSVAAEIARAGYLRQEVADAIDLDGASLSRSIAGNRQWKATEVGHIAEFLDIPVGWLMAPHRPSDDPDNGGDAVTIGYPGDHVAPVVDLFPLAA
jgi:hypothetical protein